MGTETGPIRSRKPNGNAEMNIHSKGKYVSVASEMRDYCGRRMRDCCLEGVGDRNTIVERILTQKRS